MSEPSTPDVGTGCFARDAGEYNGEQDFCTVSEKDKRTLHNCKKVVIFGVVVYLILSVAGVVHSVWCAMSPKTQGTTIAKALGVFFAFFLSPFYWVYFLFAKLFDRKFCSTSAAQAVVDMVSTNTTAQARPMRVSSAPLYREGY